jgi:hypothetical protein
MIIPFIEVTGSKGRVRIRADHVTMVMEGLAIGKDKQEGIMVQLSTNLAVSVTSDTMESLFNKLTIALGRAPGLVTETSPAFPGHIDPASLIEPEQDAA